MKENVILDKSKAFALRIIRLYQFLCETKKEYVLSKQVLRSGTSNVHLCVKICLALRMSGFFCIRANACAASQNLF